MLNNFAERPLQRTVKRLEIEHGTRRKKSQETLELYTEVHTDNLPSRSVVAVQPDAAQRQSSLM
jgi:hypothetical protein